MSTLFLIFNHHFTSEQEADARTSLAVKKIAHLPTELQELWSGIPPFLPTLKEYLEPFRAWLAAQAIVGDYVLIQGDFGASYLLVQFALKKGLIPIYSTTQREAEEEMQLNGTVRVVHHFQHRMFRRYGQ